MKLALALTAALAVAATGCVHRDAPSAAAPAADFEPPVHDLPRSDGARLSVQWIGHATMLVQMDDKFVLTDPFLSDRMALVQGRLVHPGLTPEELPKIDAVLVSHVHADHLSFSSLKRIQRKVSRVFVPQGALVYIPNYAFDARELRTWQSFEQDGLKITAVPVRHVGGRYGLDAKWMTKAFTGYVIEYHGLSVFFAGDTAYDADAFKATGRVFPHLDAALLPIAPIHPDERMRKVHMNPDEALAAVRDLGAATMIPMHFDTLRSDDAPGEARERLVAEAHARGMDDRVAILRVGERGVLVTDEGIRNTAVARSRSSPPDPRSATR